DRVCFFRIIPQTIGNADGTQREFFWVALRLIDSTNQAALGAFSRPRQPLKPGKDLATADFFDIVSSKYLDSYRQMGYSNAEMGSQYQRNRFVDPFFPINE
ncbi:hypothetical protein HYY75_06980, partial [bacterium]|nr:hypothetical protein [bacterium]